jgi:ketosteroid isomerase-like protein
MKPTFSLLLLFFFITSLYSQDEEKQGSKFNNVEEEIWSLEEEYISYFREANHNAIQSFYHPQFLGWPDSESHPAGKERAMKYLAEKHPESIQVNSQINREGIRILGNIAITHYLLHLSWKDDDGVEQTRESRLTHTWIKEGSSWKILGGMSNRK